MRYAIFSDVHANLRAWEQVLADIRDQEPDVLVCLGDAVGYGPRPEEVLQGIREVTGNFVMGNHDAAAAGAMDYSIFNAQARHSIDWTTGALSAESRKFLGEVPLSIDAEDILFVHAEISEPGRFGYIDDEKKAKANFADSDHFVTFVGHTHHPNIYQRSASGSVSELPDESRRLDPSNRYIVNVGSVGEPRNFDDLRGVYVIYDSEAREVQFRRVSFDIDAYRRDLEATSLEAKPFFLQSHEFQVAETQSARPSAAVALAMEAPAAATALISRQGAPVQLSVPDRGLRPWHPSDDAKTWGGSARVVVTLTLFGVMLAIAWVIWGIDGSANDGASEIRLTTTAPKSTVAQKNSGSLEGGLIPEPEVAILPDELPPILAAAVPSDPLPEPVASSPPPPDTPKPEPKLAAVATTPKPPAPEPELAPKVEEDPTFAWWRMEADSADNELVDAMGKHPLPALAPGKKIGGLAPSRIPANGIRNGAALSLGVWGEAEPVDGFALAMGRSFTIEGWVVTARPRRPIFLAGTRSGDANDKQGWHVDIRSRGQMSFFYDTGPKNFQALSGILPVADLRPHHFAAVWDHDFSDAAGEMRLYFEGEQVASAEIPHAQIAKAPANAFRIGASTNPPKVGLDEVRFMHAALSPLEFLRARAQTMTKKGKWADAANWSGGAPPTGTQGAVIGVSVSAEVAVKPGKFNGDLVLRESAKLTVGSREAFAVIPKSPSKLVLHQSAELILLTGNGAGSNTTFGAVELAGKATIWGGRSTSGHHTTRQFTAEITGPGALVLDGVNNNKFVLEVANEFEGGLLAKSTQKQGFHVVAKAEDSLGKGNVEIAAQASLVLEAEAAIASEATLTLTGSKDSGSASKVTLNGNNTVAALIFDGVEQESGKWGAKGSGVEHEHENFSGSATLTVNR